MVAGMREMFKCRMEDECFTEAGRLQVQKKGRRNCERFSLPQSVIAHGEGPKNNIRVVEINGLLRHFTGIWVELQAIDWREKYIEFNMRC
jgi:hypothetical protein